MSSHPESGAVLADLGDKVLEAIAAGVTAARQDLLRYRTEFPHFVSQSSKRGLANWLHDRLWHHLSVLLEGVPNVVLIDEGPTREVAVGLNYRMRLKRHHVDGDVSTYPTATAMDFLEQSQLAFPGLEQTNLIAGYVWVEESYDVGNAVLSLRDGRDNIVWLEELPEDDGQTSGAHIQPIDPERDGPTAPVIEIPPTVGGSAEEEGRPE